MNNEHLTRIQEAEIKYMDELKLLHEDWTKFYEYIIPLIEYNKTMKELGKTINMKLLMMSVSFAALKVIQATYVSVLFKTLKSTIPPLKIECPTCKKVVWDISELSKIIGTNNHKV